MHCALLICRLVDATPNGSARDDSLSQMHLAAFVFCNPEELVPGIE